MTRDNSLGSDVFPLLARLRCPAALPSITLTRKTVWGGDVGETGRHPLPLFLLPGASCWL